MSEDQDYAKKCAEDPHYAKLTIAADLKTIKAVRLSYRGMIPEIRAALIADILRLKPFEKEDKSHHTPGLSWYRMTFVVAPFEDYCTSDQEFAEEIADALLVDLNEWPKYAMHGLMRRTSREHDLRATFGVTFVDKSPPAEEAEAAL